MNTLIKSDQIWVLWAIILLITAASIYLENRYKWAKQISGAIIALIGAVILTNLNIIPMESEVYDTVWTYVIPLSIPMLLFRSNMRKIFRESGRMLILFSIGAVGTILGAILGHAVLRGAIPGLNKIAGMMTGSYIGGGVNFVALSQVFDIPKDMISATTVADNFNMALYFIILVALPKLVFFKKNFKHPYIDEVERYGAVKVQEKKEVARKMTTYDLAITFAAASSIVAVSNSLANYFAEAIPTASTLGNLGNQLLGNEYLIITTLTMILATIFPKFFEGLYGAEEIGNFLIYIFFVVIGVPASIPVIIKTAPLLLVFCFIMVMVNMAVSFLGAKLFGFTLEETIISSNANIGGPATASVMAISQGWNNLIGPGIFAGLFGYIIGNYLGTFIGNFLG